MKRNDKRRNVRIAGRRKENNKQKICVNIIHLTSTLDSSKLYLMVEVKIVTLFMYVNVCKYLRQLY